MLSFELLSRSPATRPALQQGSLFLTITAALANGLFISTSSFAAEHSIDIAPVAVTGNPLGVASDHLIVPVSVLNGRELSLRRESTLGETLNGIPGVTATQFGPNASRPVIRGLDAERVKIMQNGIGVLDASSLSFDHAVGIDPLIIEQIDVVRGPAALLYGGSAVGGVVNAIDHRIPTEPVEGLIGRAESRFGGANDERNGVAVIDIGNGRLAIHADAYKRKTNDLSIPGFAVSNRKNAADGTVRENRGRLVNSGAQSDGGALGAAITLDNGYIGTSFSTLNNNYGVVAEKDVRIDMTSNRWDIASELTDLSHVFHRVKIRLSYTDYHHQELEGSNVGSTFKNRGISGSFEAGHTPVGGLNGVIGYQFSNTNFEAIGDEAFVPNVNTQDKALYFYEEIPVTSSRHQSHKITFGGRFGHTKVDAKSSAILGAAQNNGFNSNSFALGGLYQFNPQWSLASNLSHNERAPSYFELYANGQHIATGQFEVGNRNFGLEKSNGIDAQLRWNNGKHTFNFGAYYTRFQNFIGLFDSGNIDLASGLPIANFQTVPATFKGLEAEGKFTISDQAQLLVRGDYIRAKNDRSNDYLPRISPLRLGSALVYQHQQWNAKLDVLHAFNQNNTANKELATDGYTNMSAMIAYKLPSKVHIELFAKANNLLNQEIREHASFLKDISPAGERAIIIGARADF